MPIWLLHGLKKSQKLGSTKQNPGRDHWPHDGKITRHERTSEQNVKMNQADTDFIMEDMLHLSTVNKPGLTALINTLDKWENMPYANILPRSPYRSYTKNVKKMCFLRCYNWRSQAVGSL